MSNIVQFPRRQPTITEPTVAELELELFRAINGYDGQDCDLKRIEWLHTEIERQMISSWIGSQYFDEGDSGSAA